jgi:hypothetical protein
MSAERLSRTFGFMTGYLTYAVAAEHINELHSRAERGRRVSRGRPRAVRRPVLGGARRLRRAFG